MDQCVLVIEYSSVERGRESRGDDRRLRYCAPRLPQMQQVLQKIRLKLSWSACAALGKIRIAESVGQVMNLTYVMTAVVPPSGKEVE
jgi:hypothetical protein